MSGRYKVYKQYVRFFLSILFVGLAILFCISGDLNQKGLSLLQTFKTFTGNKVDLRKIRNSKGSTISHLPWTILLSKYVDQNGGVDYLGFQNDSLNLKQYLTLLSANPPSSIWNAEDQIAYWINAYNAFTIQLIIDHLPLESVRDIGGSIPMINSAWDQKFFKIGNVSFDLNTIEHDILRVQFDEPRIHFAINCASISCPALRNEAYEGVNLEFQLQEQTRRFLLDTTKNFIGESQLDISKIFSWFASDFNNTGTVREFIETNIGIAIEEDVKIQYLDYNWNLNDQRNFE